MRLYPNSQSSATRTAKALRAAAADLDHVATGLRNAAREYEARWDTDAGPLNYKGSLSLLRMVLMAVFQRMNTTPRRAK